MLMILTGGVYVVNHIRQIPRMFDANTVKDVEMNRPGMTGFRKRATKKAASEVCHHYCVCWTKFV